MHFLLLLFTISGYHSQDLMVQSLYKKALLNERNTNELIYFLESQDEYDSSSFFLGYYGSAFALKAKYAASPIKKYTYSKKADYFLDTSIEMDPGNLDSRFLRFTLNAHLPEYLKDQNELIQDSDKFFELIELNAEKELTNFQKWMITEISKIKKGMIPD